ncbi:hypothetical protein GQ42DRAFT_164442 [Ramicandelaber brevisporus]|nr:hypothetical protein GQ42DRAFT_164442 [Ramicandelaber brevisporus]
MDAMKNLIKTKWEAEYQTKDGLRHAYQMYFDIAKGEEKKRNIPREAAVESWRDMLANHPIYKAAQQKFGRVGLLAEWCEFVENHANLAVITRDTWTQALEFLTTAQPELANHSEANAWPVLIDEFVAAMRKKHGWAKSAAAEEELYNFDDPYA